MERDAATDRRQWNRNCAFGHCLLLLVMFAPTVCGALAGPPAPGERADAVSSRVFWIIAANGLGILFWLYSHSREGGSLRHTVGRLLIRHRETIVTNICLLVFFLLAIAYLTTLTCSLFTDFAH
jgi:hypothetical protein